MKPMGQRKVRFPGKTDCHCKKDGMVNWWETENQPSKKRERQSVKREIEQEVSICI